MRLPFLFLCLSLVSCQTTRIIENQFTDDEKMRILKSIKRDDITGQLNLFFRSIDIRDYTKAREIVADNVIVDMSDGPKEKSGDEFIEMIKASHKGLDGTLHSLTNNSSYFADGKSGSFITAISTHYKKVKSGKNVKAQYGVYEIEFNPPSVEKDFWNWKISKFKYVNKFTDGNVNLK